MPVSLYVDIFRMCPEFAHTYMKEKSTQIDLYTVTGLPEKVIYHQLALAPFLDIEMAFNNDTIQGPIVHRNVKSNFSANLRKRKQFLTTDAEGNNANLRSFLGVKSVEAGQFLHICNSSMGQINIH